MATLAEVVRQQADARVRADDAWFAAWMTPQALLHLRRAPHGARSMRVLDVTNDEQGGGSSEVRYASLRGSYVLAQRWVMADGAWRCVEASCPPESRRTSMLGRLMDIFGRRNAAAMPAR